MQASDYLSRDEVARFTARSDWHAWRLVLGTWLCIAALVATVAIWPNPITVVVAVILLAGRQLALAVLMHECGHRTLFRSARLNDLVGQWLCARPVLSDLHAYARGHLEHHRKAGTAADPDLPNYRAYPVSRASFRRKVLRDLSGRTGLKLLAYVARGAAGVLSPGARASARPFLLQMLVQVLLLLVLAACGIAWVYLLWVLAYLTVFMLVIRVRQVAEHAAVPDPLDPDPRMNTRTVDAPWWQRIILAPCGVNFHLEHHFMASVPCYRLRELHCLLRDRQALDQIPDFRGYGQLLRHVVST